MQYAMFVSSEVRGVFTGVTVCLFFTHKLSQFREHVFGSYQKCVCSDQIKEMKLHFITEV